MQATNDGVTDFKTGPTNGNGNGHKTTGSFSKATSVRPSNNQVVDIILKMHRDLFEFGRERAKKSRDIKPDETDLVALEEHAQAMADEAYRERYDPEKNEEHKRRETEYQKLVDERPETEHTLNFFEADVLRLEEEMARAQVNMRAPQMPTVLMLSAVAGLALTIAPTLHDYVFVTMTDDVLNWGISILSSTIYGVFITWGLLDTDDPTGRRTVRNWLGLLGGIAIPIGLGILRAANAVGKEEILFAAALTIIEIGIVVLLEARAKTLRTSYQEWAAQEAIVNDIAARLESARSQVARIKQKIMAMQDGIDAHIRLVEELSIRNQNIDRIKADAVKAVRDGYFEGLAANRGYLRGAGRIGL
jgi:hypothetical protein